jgi:putative transposase
MYAPPWKDIIFRCQCKSIITVSIICIIWWHRKGYDVNIWTTKKRNEKLNYMHNNPVKRGLVKEPGDWPWSSWRFYFLNDASVLAMDRVREA